MVPHHCPGPKLLTVADVLAALQKLHARKAVYWRHVFDASRLDTAGALKQKLAAREPSEPLHVLKRLDGPLPKYQRFAFYSLSAIATGGGRAASDGVLN